MVRLLRPAVVASGLAMLFLAIGFSWPRSPELMASPPVFAFVSPLPGVHGAAITAPVDCAKLACLALTFDDGPDATFTPHILDTLDRHNARATFFVLGNHVAGNEQLLQRMYKTGHEIGNHSWSHPSFIKIPIEQVESEVANTQTAIMRAGVPAPHVFRPPYGDMNDIVRAHVPLTIVRWNVDPEDWHPKKQHMILEHLTHHARAGSVIVLHDTEPTTAAMLDQIIVQLQTSGYMLVTVSDLLTMPAGQPGVFFGRQNMVY